MFCTQVDIINSHTHSGGRKFHRISGKQIIKMRLKWRTGLEKSMGERELRKITRQGKLVEQGLVLGMEWEVGELDKKKTDGPL